jgi:hypothetical protein
MPGEPFVEIGLAVKAGSPFQHTLFSGYSNVGGYEVDVTPFTEDAAQVVIDESLALLRELAG